MHLPLVAAEHPFQGTYCLGPLSIMREGTNMTPGYIGIIPIHRQEAFINPFLFIPQVFGLPLKILIARNWYNNTFAYHAYILG